jgi:hypothetical protein
MKNRWEKSKKQPELVEKFRDSRLFTLNPLYMLSNTGEPLYGGYLPLTEGALGRVVRRGIGFCSEAR